MTNETTDQGTRDAAAILAELMDAVDALAESWRGEATSWQEGGAGPVDAIDVAEDRGHAEGLREAADALAATIRATAPATEFTRLAIGVYPTTIQAARDAVDFLSMRQATRGTLELTESDVAIHQADGVSIFWRLEDESDLWVWRDNGRESWGSLGEFLDTLELDDDEHDRLSDAIREAMSDLLAYAAACATAGLNLLGGNHV